MPQEHSKMIEIMSRIFFLIFPTKAGSGDVFPALTPLADLEIFCHGIYERNQNVFSFYFTSNTGHMSKSLFF